MSKLKRTIKEEYVGLATVFGYAGHLYAPPTGVSYFSPSMNQGEASSDYSFGQHDFQVACG